MDRLERRDDPEGAASAPLEISSEGQPHGAGGAREDELYDIDIEGLEEEEETPRALRAGFSKPPQQALPQGADLIMDTEAPMETEMEPVPQEAGEGPAAAQPPSPPAPEPIQKEDAVEDAFEISLRVAKSWLNVKQAIRGIAKTGWPTDEQWAMAWDTFITTGDKVDILADPFLFRCWLESGPSADAIDGNLRVMELDSAFQKLSDDAKTRIRERCAEVKES